MIVVGGLEVKLGMVRAVVVSQVSSSIVADPANSFFDDEKSGTSPDLLVSRESGPTQLSFSPAFLLFVAAAIQFSLLHSLILLCFSLFLYLSTWSSLL